MQTPSQYVNFKNMEKWYQLFSLTRTSYPVMESIFSCRNIFTLMCYVVRIFKSCWKHVGQFMLNIHSWRHLWMNILKKNLWQLSKISYPIHLLILMWILCSFFDYFIFYKTNFSINQKQNPSLENNFHENKFQSYINYKRNKRTKTEKPQIYLLWKHF